MKFNVLAFVSLTTVATLLWSSCDRIDDTTSQGVVAAQDGAVALRAFVDAFHLADEVSRFNDQASTEKQTARYFVSTCTEVTVNPAWPDSTFPKTIEIDLGSPSCNALDRRRRSGRLTMQISGFYRDAGTSITIDVDSFSFTDHMVSGSMTIVNNGTINGGISYNMTVTGGSYTVVNGPTSTLEFSGVIQLVEGLATDLFLSGSVAAAEDDVYLLTGSGSGQSSSQIPYTMTVSTPVRHLNDCLFPVSGNLDFTTEGNDDSFIDYGVDSCDNEYDLTVDDEAYVIKMI